MEPLSPELVDELLSADLDGAFDAAAREHGYAPAIARELLDETPGVAQRRAALAEARGATAVTPLAAAERDALVAGALRAARVDDLADARAGRRPGLGKYVAVAAALLVVAGLGVTVANVSGRGDDSSTSAGQAATASTSAAKSTESDTATRDDAGSSPTSRAPEPPAALSFGAVDSADALRQRVEAALGTAVSAGGRLQENRSAAEPEPPAACVTKQAQALGVDPALVLHGSTVYAGTPAEVLVFRRGNDALVVVVADPEAACRLLASQLLHQGS
jgi:hypothetical protein